MTPPEPLSRHDDWSGVHVVVAGLGLSGYAAARALAQVGAQVLVVDERDGDEMSDKAQALDPLGTRVRLGAGATDTLPGSVDVVVTSPGWSPSAPLLTLAAARGVPVWGEVELAWRLRDPDHAAPWLAVTGTNGKTTTVQMLDSMLAAAGLRSQAVGNVGRPVVEAVTGIDPFDVLAVELSSFQLHWTHSVSTEASAVLNIAADHVDWYSSPDEYVADKGRIFRRSRLACVYNVSDPATERLVRDAGAETTCRAVGFTLGAPTAGMLGVVDGVLVDRAFVDNRRVGAVELCRVGDVVPPAPHNIANALAAAALARAHGVPPQAVRDGLRGFRIGGHRIASVASVGGVDYVDDSKATNPHAAGASLTAFDPVVWIAGGLAKGAAFDELVASVRDRLRAVVLLGRDRRMIADALARHAPDVRVLDVPGTDTLVMDRVVTAAAGAAQAGDTVLLAPGCASMDLFVDYAARGDAFAAAVRRLAERRSGMM